MTTRMKNAEVVDTTAQRLKALTDNVAAKAEITMDGARYTRAQLAAIYQAALDTRSALVKSRAQVKVDLAARGKAEANRVAIESGLKAWVVAQFGPRSNEAYEFGYTPRKPGVASVETKANAQKLATATRAARGTMGKKQKLKVKGTLVAPTEPAVPAAASVAPVQSTVVAKANGAVAAPVAPSTQPS